MLISDVLFKIKIFPMQLGNQNLLQYWDNDGPPIFIQYLSSSIIMIFGKSRSLKKKYQIHVKNRLISGVLFKIKKSQCN